VASRSTPASAIAVRRLVTLASRPHKAVITAMVRLLLTDQADRVRATRSAGVWSSRYAAYTGLNTPMQMSRPSWTAMTSSRPPAPGRTNASPMGQQARSVPAVRITGCRPYRATRRRDSREPRMPPTHGAAKARPYCHGANPRWASMRTEMSGSTAMIRPPTRIWLKNTGRSTGWVRMYRQPSDRSRARGPGCPGEPAAALRAGRDSLPPIAEIPAADSR
jgi:hypothetical protein